MKAPRRCRFCGCLADRPTILKYGVRHYAHADCIVQYHERGVEVLAALPSHEIARAPVLHMRMTFGIDVEELYDAARRREARGGDPRRADSEHHAKTP